MMEHTEPGGPAIPNNSELPDPPRQFRNAIILPDGRKSIPLGSGTVTALLGEGGMANVYEIWNPQLEVHRAVKLLHPNCSDESKQRFQTEIKITAKLHHPNIIEIHGVGEWNSLPLIEMEKITGHTLETLIGDRGALPVTFCTAIGIMIARSLKYAHNQVYVIYGQEYHGVIHRDLKPSNIMVSQDGAVKLMDFGIARPTDASIHTTDGAILGTMQYLSPEQLDGKEPDVRTDIYSLGATLYEILTGEQAFPERNVSKLMMKKIKNDYKPLDHYNIKIPGKLKKLIHKCMMHDREKRIPNSTLLLAELEKIHKQVTQETPAQCIRQLLMASTSKKVATVKRLIPWKIILSVVFLAAASATIPTFFARYKSWRALEEAGKKKAEMPPVAMALPAPQPAVQNHKKASVSPVKNPSSAKTVRMREKPAEPKPVRKPPTLVERLAEKHGTQNLVEILVSEVGQGNFSEASKLYDALSPSEKDMPKAVIYQLRSLQGLGGTNAVQAHLKAHPIEDGEVYLAKAKLAYAKGKFVEASQLLDQSLKSTRQFMDSDRLRKDVVYYKALCATSLFDVTPNEGSYKQALDAWWQVRNEMRTSPTHKYNKKALSETQRIAEKFRASKG